VGSQEGKVKKDKFKAEEWATTWVSKMTMIGSLAITAAESSLRRRLSATFRIARRRQKKQQCGVEGRQG
jgi:hypothetical protein